MMKEFVLRRLDFICQFVALVSGLFILIPLKFKPYLVVLLIILALFSCFLENHKLTFSFKKSFSIIIVFVIYLATMLYSENLERGLTLLVRMIPLILIPISISVLPEKHRIDFLKIFTKSFIISCGVYSVLIFVYLFKLGCLFGPNTLSYGYSYITFLFFGINDHPIYISSYFAVGLLLMIFNIKRFDRYYFILFFLTLSGLLILSRKGPILSFLICAGLYFIKNRNLYLSKVIPFFLLVGSLFFMIPEIRNRFLELVDFSSFTLNSQTSTGIRYTIWLNAVELIKDSPIFGYGIGDVFDISNSNFLKNGLIEYNKMAYNAHNQFLQIALASGLLGLTIFLFFQIKLVVNAFKSKNLKLLILFLFFQIVFTSESYLERQNGIIFYSLILSLFTYSNLNYLIDEK